jgi:DNA repair exonuclease SbcCD ATPase subunit
MRFIAFKNIKIKNFLSFGDTPVDVNFRSGVNAIVGSNLDKEDSKNGCGKSTICDALYYTLYGTTLRELSKDFICNTLTNKLCEVSLTLDIASSNVTDSYTITRKLNPTKCILTKNGENVTRSTLAKTNAYIQELIHTPATVFQNSVIMSVNSTIPFMALPKTDRRKFIESVLGLEVFTSMVLKARDDYSILKKDYEVEYTKFEGLDKELQFNVSQFENYETLKQERISRQTEKQHKIQKDIQVLQEKIIDLGKDNLTDVEQKLVKITNAIQGHETTKQSLISKLHKVEAEINSETKQIKQLKNTKDLCPTCKRDYSEDHIHHIQELITKHEDSICTYQQALEKLNNLVEIENNSINNLKSEYIIVTADKNKIVKQVADNNNTILSISHLETNLQDIETEIASIRREQNNELKGKITTLTASVQETNEKVTKLNNELNILETVKFVISEEGIKSFIVKKILKVLNSRLAYYLKKLEANCLCQFNEFFDEEIIDESSQPKSYFNFSGGERKRIDLACLFAFADIRRLQGDVNFNTVFYDELLDSSLDDKGVYLTLKTLRERFNEVNESCYIITHRGMEVTAKAEHTIHVIKQNGISTIKE